VLVGPPTSTAMPSITRPGIPDRDLPALRRHQVDPQQATEGQRRLRPDPAR
jgi:hypothetical protein